MKDYIVVGVYHLHDTWKDARKSWSVTAVVEAPSIMSVPTEFITTSWPYEDPPTELTIRELPCKPSQEQSTQL